MTGAPSANAMKMQSGGRYIALLYGHILFALPTIIIHVYTSIYVPISFSRFGNLPVARILGNREPKQ